MYSSVRVEDPRVSRTSFPASHPAVVYRVVPYDFLVMTSSVDDLHFFQTKKSRARIRHICPEGLRSFRSERGNNARVRLKRSCKVRYAVFQGHSVSHSLYSLVHASHAHWYRARLYGPIPCRTSRNACVTTFPNLKLAGGSILDSPATFRRATPELHRKLLGIWNDLTETFCSKGGSFLVVSSAL